MSDVYDQAADYDLVTAIGSTGAMLESLSARPTPAQVRASLQDNGQRRHLDHLQGILTNHPTLDWNGCQALLRRAEQGLQSIRTGTVLTASGRVGLEALVCLSGRPAIPTMNGDVDYGEPLLGEWADRIAVHVTNGTLARRIASVGRIDEGGKHMGTGFVVGDGLVLTNRHVLDEIARPVPSAKQGALWQLHPDVSISFADDPDKSGEALRFKIIGVVGAGSERIDNAGNFRLLDAALLRVDTKSSGDGFTFPSPATMLRDAAPASLGRAILAIGYPAAPDLLPKFEGNIDEEGMAALQKLFSAYGKRTLSPGMVTATASGVKGTQDYWVFGHDATTLGGSSGSCIIELEGSARTVGLHCSGAWRVRNYAHAVAHLAPSVPFLNAPGVQWA